MGCIFNKQPATEDDIMTLQLIPHDGLQLKRRKKAFIIMTPTGLLTVHSAPLKKLSAEVIDFYAIINNEEYDKCLYTAHKDLYFTSEFVYTLERTSIWNIQDRVTLAKINRTMVNKQYMLIPKIIQTFYMGTQKEIILQKMEFCSRGDLYDYSLQYMGTKNFKLHDFVYHMASTLLELHSSSVYLTDVKLENIFLSRNWMYADTEYAFIDPPLLDQSKYDNLVERKEHIRQMKKRYRWMKTYNYLPDNRFPCTKKLLVRNDVFAFARCIGNIVSRIFFNCHVRMFHGNEDMVLYDERESIKEKKIDMYNSPYFLVTSQCIVHHAVYATDDYLRRVIEIAKRHITI